MNNSMFHSMNIKQSTVHMIKILLTEFIRTMERYRYLRNMSLTYSMESFPDVVVDQPTISSF